MSEQPDPERLLADALRAQAVRAPHPEPEPGTSDSLVRLFSDSPYGLLSGQHSYQFQQPEPVRDTPYTQQITGPKPLSVGWIVLLAVLLGLAAGAVIGLVSVL